MTWTLSFPLHLIFLEPFPSLAHDGRRHVSRGVTIRLFVLNSPETSVATKLLSQFPREASRSSTSTLVNLLKIK